MTDEPAVVVLDGSTGDRASFGGKGAALDRLVEWSLPVPPTAIVTASVCRRMSAAPDVAALVGRLRDGETVDAAEVDRTFATTPIDDALAAEIVAAARTVADGRRLAFRSSATVEDLAASSFAGQYRSVLDVDPTDDAEVLDAVRMVVASLWHPAPCAYRRAFGIDDADVAMAVVMMRMVPARQAGVVFTVDPGGRPGAARIEVVEGLGESLVSGRRTPTAHVVDRPPAPSGLDPHLDEALRLAAEAERRSGAPQDVEWAWDGTTTWIVQARPITVTEEEGDGFDTDPGDHELTTAGIGEMLPGVLPPLVWQINSHLVDAAFARILADLGVTPPGDGARSLVHRVRGRAALDFDALREMAQELPGGSAEELEVQYFGSGRPATHARRRRRALPRHLLHDLRVLATHRQVVTDADTVHFAARQLGHAPCDLAGLDDRELMARRARLIDLGVRAMGAELGAAAVATSAFARLELMLSPHLGLRGATAAAASVTARRGVVVAAAPTSSTTVFAGPTWEESGASPAPVVDHRASSGGADDLDDGDAALRELEARLRATDTWGTDGPRAWIRTVSLHRLVDEAAEQLHRRERTKAAVMSLGGSVRRVHLELGRRLVERGALHQPSHVDLLDDRELRDALAGRAPAPAVVARRERWRTRYESEGPLPPRFRGAPDRTEVALPAGDRLEGWAASPGRVEAPAQVVAAPTDPVPPGTVIVADAADASWSPLFVDAAAIVLERGGPLSHAAILARELGVPAVFNLTGATRALSGRRVLVDGDAGVVVILGEEVP